MRLRYHTLTDATPPRGVVARPMLNAPFEGPVIETKHGGQGGGAGITPLGYHVIDQYHVTEAKAHAAADAELADLAAATNKPGTGQ
jgi:molybdate transport repressor ModE-like protein